jgi:membrane-associated phospholipid phosphatase
VSRRIIASAVAGMLACALPAHAESATETAGTGVAIALPLFAGTVTLVKNDWRGTAQLAVSTALTVGTVYALKKLVRECRPFAEPCTHSSSNWDSFPSETSAAAFAPAQFLWQRYGWEYGVPAYAAAGFVAWSRVDAKQHHWWDTVTSAAISLGYNELITTRYRRNFDVEASPNGVYATVHYAW